MTDFRRKVEGALAGAALATLKIAESKDPFGTLAGMLENAAVPTVIDTTAVEVYTIEVDGNPFVTDINKEPRFKVLDGSDKVIARGMTKEEAKALVKRLQGKPVT